MFRLIITVVYMLPLLYVFFRVRHLFIPKGYRWLYTGIFILLALLYPVFSIYLQEEPGGLSRILQQAGYYAMVLFLYLFLSLLLFDLFLLFNRLIHIVSRPVMKSSRQKVKGLLIMLAVSAAVVAGGIIHFNTIRTVHYGIEIPKRSSPADHLRIVFVADFHLQSNTSLHFAERVIEKINALQPDLMLFGGDIVEGDGDEKKLARFERLLRQIDSEYGSYGVIGNHEIYAGSGTKGFFSKAGIHLLKDTSIVIDRVTNLTGRYDQHIDDRKSPEELLKYSTDTLPAIMLDHRPTEIARVSRTRVDIQLSGHTHNGQLFPFNLITRCIYPLSWGYEKIRDTHFFVTSGIRLWGPPVRTAGNSEIVVIDVRLR